MNNTILNTMFVEGEIAYNSNRTKKLIKEFLDKYNLSYTITDNEFTVNDYDIEYKTDIKEFMKLINDIVRIDNYYDQDDVTTLSYKLFWE